MKNITDFLLNIFLQLYASAYGKQILPDFVMHVHSANSQEIKQTIWLYSINDNKISNFQADSIACNLVHLFVQTPSSKSDRSILPFLQYVLSQPPMNVP